MNSKLKQCSGTQYWIMKWTLQLSNPCEPQQLGKARYPKIMETWAMLSFHF